MVSQELLDILRCPACVSDPERRKNEKDPGALLFFKETWLVCQSPGCNRKYPVKDDIPIMLIDEGDKWVNAAVDALPIPPPSEPTPAPAPAPAAPAERPASRSWNLAVTVIMLLLVIAVLVYAVWPR